MSTEGIISCAPVEFVLLELTTVISLVIQILFKLGEIYSSLIFKTLWSRELLLLLGTDLTWFMLHQKCFLATNFSK